jgi:hypothetical protein
MLYSYIVKKRIRETFEHGLHVFTLRWGKVYALDMFEDTQEVARGLAAQAAAGLEEAVAEQIVS